MLTLAVCGSRGATDPGIANLRWHNHMTKSQADDLAYKTVKARHEAKSKPRASMRRRMGDAVAAEYDCIPGPASRT